MAVPSFLNGSFRYFTRAAVTDVQTIMDDLYAELVTGLSWTCTVGGVGVTPTTYKSPVGSQGEFFTVNFVRIAATNLQIIMTDSYGLLVNNETHQHLFIDAGGTDIFLYTGAGMPYLCIDAERAVPETWWGCQIDRYPDTAYMPTWVCSGGPRTDTESLSYNIVTYAHWRSHASGDTTYNGSGLSGWVADHAVTAGSFVNKTQSGALLFWPLEYQAGNIYYGKVPNCLFVDSSQAFKADVTVPIDTGVSVTFRVTGPTVSQLKKLCWRKV